MIKFTRFAILATLAAISSISARADSFDFSYTFHDGNVWSGSFDGTANGNLVTGISNVSLFENGVSVGTPIYAGSYNSGYQLGGTVFSFDGLQNNIALFDGNYFQGQAWNAYLIAGDPFNDNIYYYHNGNFDYDASIVTSRWSLTASGVPDSGTTVALLGGALLGFAAMRRKFSRL